MKTINVGQGSPEWHAWRSQGVTATDMAVLLGASPYKTGWRLWAEKTGLLPEEDLSANPLVRHGKAAEAAIRRHFEQKYDAILLPLCAESSIKPLIRCSFDGVNDHGVSAEFKGSSDKVFEEVVSLREASKAYQVYEPQVQAQIFVSGKDHGYLVFGLVKEERGDAGPFLRVVDTIEFIVRRDDARLAVMVERAEAFHKSVVEKIEPLKDPARDPFIPSSDEERLDWGIAARQLRAIDTRLSVAREIRDGIKVRRAELHALLCSEMGQNAKADHAGIRVTRSPRRGKLDGVALVKAHAPNLTDEDLDRYRTAPHGVTKVINQRAGVGDEEDWLSEEDDKSPAVTLVDQLYVPSTPAAETTWLELGAAARLIENEYLAAKKAVKDIESERKAIGGRFIVMMGEFANAEHDGVLVCRYTQRGRIDFTAVIKEHAPGLPKATVDKFRRDSSVTTKVTFSEPATADGTAITKDRPGTADGASQAAA
jgi:putative phage-type endonuclease